MKIDYCRWTIEHGDDTKRPCLDHDVLHRRIVISEEECQKRLRPVVDTKLLSNNGRTGGVHTVTVIRPHLLLCGATAIRNTTLHDLQVTCVVHATNELPDTPLPSSQTLYLRVPLPDNPEVDLLLYMDVVADLIHQVGESGGRTLVHCLAGVSRSAALCLAYLVKHEGLSLCDAYRELRVLRPIVRPNAGFLKQLLKFEEIIESGRSAAVREL